MLKVKSKPFKNEYYTNGGLTFYPYYKATHADIAAGDTETKLYYNNELLTEERAAELVRDNGQQWAKENIEVRAYAFILAVGEACCIFTCIEDFLTACASLNVKIVVWYNAKFDFSIFDYYFLINGWELADEHIRKKERYGKLKGKTYSSLDGNFGQRYQMQIWQDYVNVKNLRKVHKFKMIDICNICAGGLAKNLISWDIKDSNGNEIRKLKMDYVADDIERAAEYMTVDGVGLYFLAVKIDETFKTVTGYSLFAGDYMTAGGLAIKTLLHYMYLRKTPKADKTAFKKEFLMSPELDKKCRDMHLYLGGRCCVNPYKRGVVQRNIYKYDVNSMYPDKMRNMLYPVGRGKVLKNGETPKSNKLYVYCISGLVGRVKPDKIPFFMDFTTKKYEETLTQDEPFLIWREELEELQKWYDLAFTVDYIVEYDAKQSTGAHAFVDTFYNIKNTTKGAKKLAAKLILNSSYGKLAQRIEREKVFYTLSESGNYARLQHGEIEIDKGAMLSVLVGSRITALARVQLMQYIRYICKENVKDNFIYCDTDSVHALTEFNDTDEKALGKMKNEGVFKYGLYLAPKSYLLQSYEGEYEVHTKGVNTDVVKDSLKGKTMTEATEIFTANKTFRCLCGMNCKGGKALIYIDKMILNDKNYFCDKNAILNDGIYYELE